MASTVILKVDLDCNRCYKKISKALCKLQEKESIETITFDEMKNTVTISGPFDPKKICKKLCCKAGNVIKDIQIKQEDDQKKEKEKEKPAEPVKDKPKDVKPDKPADEPKKDKPKDAKPAAEPKTDPKPPAEPKSKEKEKDKDKDKDQKPKEQPADLPKKETPKPAPPAPEPVKEQPVYVAQEPQPIWPSGSGGCGCGCRPWADQGYYYADGRCCWCGRPYYGWLPVGQPPVVVYGAPAYGACKLICEEDPQSCSIM